LTSTTPSTPPAPSSNGSSGGGYPRRSAQGFSQSRLQNFKDVGSLAKSYGELDRYLTTNPRVPPQDAKPEDWETFYTRIGGLRLPINTSLSSPRGHIDDSLLGSFRGTASAR
jgi:hypothetical protein